MKDFRAIQLFRSRYALAVVAGLLLAASFPNFNVAGFAWIAPGVIAAAALGKAGWESFRIGYVAGLAHYLAMLYWLLLIPYRWHGVPLGPAAGWLALSAFMALFPALWVWFLFEVLLRRTAPMIGTTNVAVANPQFLFWSGRVGWTISGAIGWVAIEMLIARIFTGFPWDLLGVSQHQILPLIQISSITGVYGVSFLVVWGSLSLLTAVLTIMRSPTLRSAWVGEILFPFAVVAMLFNYGYHRIQQNPASDRSLKVTFVQPSIPQTLIWDDSRDDERFARLIALSEQALTNQTDLLLWPEAAVPKLLRYNKETFEAVTNLARKHHVWLIIGADDAEPKKDSTNPRDADYYNSSFLISPEGRLTERYRKRALVIFGEYIPLIRWIPFFKLFTPIQGGFSSGDRPVPFLLDDLAVKTSVLICFEDVFPHLAREYADADTDFLVNLTNNGWFGEGAAQWQHAMSALFRAVENGLPLLRCSNNGLTCWVDAHGRMQQFLLDANGTIYGEGVMTADIPITSPGQKPPQTFYTTHGDWFGWICALVTIARILLWSAFRSLAKAKKASTTGV